MDSGPCEKDWIAVDGQAVSYNFESRREHVTLSMRSELTSLLLKEFQWTITTGYITRRRIRTSRSPSMGHMCSKRRRKSHLRTQRFLRKLKARSRPAGADEDSCMTNEKSLRQRLGTSVAAQNPLEKLFWNTYFADRFGEPFRKDMHDQAQCSMQVGIPKIPGLPIWPRPKRLRIVDGLLYAAKVPRI